MPLIPGFVRRRRGWWLAAIVVLLLAGGLIAWSASRDKPRYVTATVSRGTIQRSVSMTGALNPVTTVQVGSYVSGTIKKLTCDFNTEVVVGQPCALVDPVPFQLVVDQDVAQLNTSAAQLKKDQAALVYAKVAYERDAKLVNEGTVSQDTVDSEKSAYDQAIAEVGVDQATIAQRRAALKAAQVNLEYTNIVSPVVGTVITRSIDVGQTVAASLQTPTLFIIGKDLTKMQVDTNVSEADVGAVRLAQDAFFSVQSLPGRTFHGTVTQIRRGPITVQNVVTYDVVIAFDNPRRLLFPGMTADTHIVIDEHHDVLRVPLPAIRFTPQGIGRSKRDGGASARGGAGAETTPGTADAIAADSAGSPGETASEAPAPGGGERERGGGEGHFRAGNRGPRGGGDSEANPASGEAPGGAGGRQARGEGRGSGGEGRGMRRRAGGANQPGQVWILADGKLKAVPVTVGLDDGANVEVSGPGLTAGETVVVNQISRNDQKRAGSALGPGVRPAVPGGGGPPRF